MPYWNLWVKITIQFVFRHLLYISILFLFYFFIFTFIIIQGLACKTSDITGSWALHFIGSLLRIHFYELKTEVSFALHIKQLRANEDKRFRQEVWLAVICSGICRQQTSSRSLILFGNKVRNSRRSLLATTKTIVI